MRFAVVGGERLEAAPGLTAECPVCGQAMIARCGEHRVWHWAHRGTRNCDTWWEPETEWHRGWKKRFPKDWQEIIQWSNDGEKHIADVKTESGMVIEFQHSNLRREERESRETFYRKMVWVVDGRRRVRDRARFFKSLGEAAVVNRKPLTVSLPSNEGALLRDWAGSRVPVFLDFGDTSEPGDALVFVAPVLWRLDPRSPEGWAHLSPVPKASFLGAYLKGLPLKDVDYWVAIECARALRDYSFLQHTHFSRQPMSFRQYMDRRERARRSRFRL